MIILRQNQYSDKEKEVHKNKRDDYYEEDLNEIKDKIHNLIVADRTTAGIVLGAVPGGIAGSIPGALVGGAAGGIIGHKLGKKKAKKYDKFFERQLDDYNSSSDDDKDYMIHRLERFNDKRGKLLSKRRLKKLVTKEIAKSK